MEMKNHLYLKNTISKTALVQKSLYLSLYVSYNTQQWGTLLFVNNLLAAAEDGDLRAICLGQIRLTDSSANNQHYSCTLREMEEFYVLLAVPLEYNRVNKDQLDAQLILSIFRQPLHVSGVSRPIIRRYNHIYTTVGAYYSF
jgi:hypothetical protein